MHTCIAASNLSIHPDQQLEDHGCPQLQTNLAKADIQLEMHTPPVSSFYHCSRHWPVSLSGTPPRRACQYLSSHYLSVEPGRDRETAASPGNTDAGRREVVDPLHVLPQGQY
jgi:hypothetical protein